MVFHELEIPWNFMEYSLKISSLSPWNAITYKTGDRYSAEPPHFLNDTKHRAVSLTLIRHFGVMAGGAFRLITAPVLHSGSSERICHILQLSLVHVKIVIGQSQ